MTPLTQIHADGRVAERYGLEEAIFLHALMFWYRTNRGNNQNFHDGRWWTYNSVKAFEEIFPWWTAGQIRRVITRCKEKGAMLTGSFAEDRRDRTAWYTPSNELLMLYGENVNCICTNQQMQSQEPASSDAENDKCNIRNTWGNHGETDMTPCSPPAGDSAPAESEPGDRPQPKPKSSRRDKSAPAHAPEAFETFWAKYPRKDGRKAAIRAWDKLKPDKPLCRTMYAALKRQRGSIQWAEDGGRYIPLFSTWLNGRKWEDQGVDLSLLTAPPDTSGGWAYDPEVIS